MQHIIFLQPLEIEHWQRYSYPFRLFPKSIGDRIIKWLPTTELAEVLVELPNDEEVHMQIIGYPITRNPQEIAKKIRQSGSSMVFWKGEPGGQDGLVAKTILLLESLKRQLERANEDCKSKRNFRILVWGADGELGEMITRVLAYEWSSLIVGGDNINRLRKLAHDLLFEFGTSLKISSDLFRDFQAADYIVLAKTLKEPLLINQQESSRGTVIKGPEIKNITNRFPETFEFHWDFTFIEILLSLQLGEKRFPLEKFLSYKTPMRSTLKELGFEITPEKKRVVAIYP